MSCQTLSDSLQTDSLVCFSKEEANNLIETNETCLSCFKQRKEFQKQNIYYKNLINNKDSTINRLEDKNKISESIIDKYKERHRLKDMQMNFLEDYIEFEKRKFKRLNKAIPWITFGGIVLGSGLTYFIVK